MAMKVAFSNPYYRIDHFYDRQIEAAGWHSHPFYELFYFVSGSIFYSLGEQKIKICPGDILLINQKTRHAPLVSGNKTYNRYVVSIAPEVIDSFRSPQTDLTRHFQEAESPVLFFRLDADTHQKIKALIERLVKLEKDNSYGADIYQLFSVLEILVLLNTSAEHIDRWLSAKAAQSQPLLTAIQDYIKANIQSNLTLDSIANYFFISKYHLCHLFRDKLHQSVHTYIIQHRLTLAKKLLIKGYKLSQVAQDCGFGDYAGMYRAFRQYEQMSPSQYIQAQQMNNVF